MSHAQLLNGKNPDYTLVMGILDGLIDEFVDGLASKGISTIAHQELKDAFTHNLHVQNAWREYTVVTAGPCIVGLRKGKQWWAADTVLEEEFIIRYKPGDFAETIEQLETLARLWGCKHLAISDVACTREASYSKYLSRKGFRQVSTTHLKDIT